MRLLVVAAFLVPGLVRGAPTLPHNNGIARGVNDITTVFEPQNSCIVILFKGVLLCIEDLRNFDNGSAFPNGDQLKPYIDYRDCLLKRKPDCERPQLPELTEEIMAKLNGMDINALARDFEMLYADYRVENLLKGLQDGRGKEDTGEVDVDGVSVNNDE
ncbi:hypothetical protein VMCG_00255 [Cytospora schulzeri]|uniref:Uncharacterized protein n=1 Tax=Cytospora schulzeri TaxID=448051 RepID=A0A423XA79_9PEZI|nr:hypothetical protein VMCG_00255 [Valsa malicola]